MVLLREEIERHLGFSLEGEFKMPVELISPTGAKQTKSANDATADLVGQVVYDSRVEDPVTGSQSIIHDPSCTLRVSSLDSIPAPGENWLVRIPIAPSYTATKEDYVIQEIVDGRSFGWIQLRLVRAEQS